MSWDGASAGILPCPEEARLSCINLVLSHHLRSRLRSAKACENEEQTQRKIFLWVSEATATGAASTIVSLTLVSPSFVISDKTGADSLAMCRFYFCLSTHGWVWPSRRVFVNPWGRAHKHGKTAVKSLEFQTHAQTVHIYLTPHTPALTNKMNENNNQASQVLPNFYWGLQ